MASLVESLTINGVFDDDPADPCRDLVDDLWAELGGRSVGDMWPSAGDVWPSVGDLDPDPPLPDDSDGGPVTTGKSFKKRVKKDKGKGVQSG